MADAALKEDMRVAFTEKMKEEKVRLDFTQLQSDEAFGDIVSSLEDWNDLSGAEKKQRSMSLFGESGKTKGYKLAKKYCKSTCQAGKCACWMAEWLCNSRCHTCSSACQNRCGDCE